MKNERAINFILNAMAIIGFLCSLVDRIPELISKILFILAWLCLLILIYANWNRRTVSRKKMIKEGNNILQNVESKAVLFGGDLSWCDDYWETLKKLLDDNKIVEVYFPSTKFYNAPNSFAEEKLINRIDKLARIGVNIYTIDNDYRMRCIITDPEGIGNHEKTKVLLADRRKIKRNKEKSRYKIEHVTYKEIQEVCKMIITVYNLIKMDAKLF